MGKRRKGPRFRGFDPVASDPKAVRADSQNAVTLASVVETPPLDEKPFAIPHRPSLVVLPRDAAEDEFLVWQRARETDSDWWRDYADKMLAHAFDTASPLHFSAQQYHEAQAFVRREHERYTTEHRGAAIDHDRRWTRLQYHCLRNEYRWHKDPGREAYSASAHWRAVKRSQLVEHDRCDRCRSGEYLEVHHLHYGTIGAERVGHDLLTLCFRCHRLEEGLAPTRVPHYGAWKAPANLTAVASPIREDDIPF